MQKAHPWKLTISLILFSWAVALLSILSLLILPALLWSILVSVSKKSWITLSVLLLLNPLSVAFIMGVNSYLGGRPHLMGMGLPGDEYYNIDRKTRCFYSTGGCLIDGHEWVYMAPNNLAVRTMAFVFGPPSQSYDGPYPSKEEAVALTNDAPNISIDEFCEGRIVLKDQTIQLEKPLAEDLLGFMYYFAKNKDEDTDLQLRAVIHEKRCLLLRIKINDGDPNLEKYLSGDSIALIDLESKTPFACYRIKGTMSSRIWRTKYVANKTQRSDSDAGR